ncbi:MAG: hypothetical protein NWQ45_00255, partial [Congregibacter sp.]|nr:hypothetical protein [Congregibacter sp.]
MSRIVTHCLESLRGVGPKLALTILSGMTAG